MEKELYNKTIVLDSKIFTESGMVDKLPDLSLPPSMESISKWIRDQHNMRNLINKTANVQLGDIKIVAGLDISYEPTKQSDKTRRMFKGLAAITIHDYLSRDLLLCFVMEFKTSVPYEKGILSLREVPVFMEMLNQIKNNHKRYLPDLLIVDGSGQWHESSAGSATMLSVYSGIPAIGIAKDYYEIKGVTPSKDEIKQQRNIEARNKGDTIVMKRQDNNNLMGIILNVSGAMQRDSDIVSNNAFMYISVGDKIDLLTAVLVVKHLSVHATCEPIRTSDFAASYFFNK